MLRRLRFERGELRFYADYVRGRCMKTTIVVRADGTFMLGTMTEARCRKAFGSRLATIEMWFRLPRDASSNSRALLAFLGLALTLTNWLSLALIVLPIFWAFGRRIAIEESALERALGTPYANYTRRTKRLVPFIY